MDKTEEKKQSIGSLLVGKFGVIIGLVVLCVIFGTYIPSSATLIGNFRSLGAATIL